MPSCVNFSADSACKQCGQGMDKAERNGSSSRSAFRRRATALSLTVLLIQACASGDVAAVADLVSKKNADPFASDESGRTPLGVAREAGHIEVIKFLMERDKERRALRGAGGTTSTYTAQPTGKVTRGNFGQRL